MGLDHWIYKMRKSNPAIVASIDGKRYDEAEKLLAGTDGMLVAAVDETQDMEHVADKVTLTCFETDEDELRRAHGIPPEAVYCGGRYSPGYVKMDYRLGNWRDDDAQYFSIELDDAEFRAYDVPVKREFWVCDGKQLRQWRKRYDIQDMLYANYDIVNCGFHRICDDEVLDKLEDLDDDLTLPRLRDGEAIYYHEWY